MFKRVYLPEGFRVVREIGEGAFGTVYECASPAPAPTEEGVEPAPDEVVAVKVIDDFSCAEKYVDDKYRARYVRRICREIEILLHFRGVPQIVEAKSVYLSPDGLHLHIMMTCVPLSLLRLLDRRVPYQGFHLVDMLDEQRSRWIIMQILIGLAVLHQSGVMHRDLSLGNILIDPETMDTYIADFGLSRVCHFASGDDYSLDVTTLPYRSPEVLMQCTQYTNAVDIWSAGCIAAELLLKAPFCHAKDAINQLWAIMRTVTGFIDVADWETRASDRAKNYLRNVAQTNADLPKVPDMIGMFQEKGVSQDGAEVVAAMLRLLPERRATAVQLLEMKWFTGDPSCVEAIEQGLEVAGRTQPCPCRSDDSGMTLTELKPFATSLCVNPGQLLCHEFPRNS